jgi:hypothetical protein
MFLNKLYRNDHVKVDDGMGRAHRRYERDEEFTQYKILVGRLEGCNHLVGLGLDGR